MPREKTYRQAFLLGGIIRGAGHAGGIGHGNDGKWSEIKIRRKSPLDRTKRAREREETEAAESRTRYKKKGKEEETKTEAFSRGISRFL